MIVIMNRTEVVKRITLNLFRTSDLFLTCLISSYLTSNTHNTIPTLVSRYSNMSSQSASTSEWLLISARAQLTTFSNCLGNLQKDGQLDHSCRAATYKGILQSTTPTWRPRYRRAPLIHTKLNMVSSPHKDSRGSELMLKL